MVTPDSKPSGSPSSAATPAPDDVLAQLERLLSSAPFRQSRRSQSLLRFVVDNYLNSHEDQLREKIIGIEVFGRDAAYDTSHDAIVRNAAIEVRKRLAQYYLDPAHASELRIELPAGSYIPVFNQEEHPAAPPSQSNGRARLFWLGLASAAVLFVCAAVWLWPAFRSDDFDRFWAPVLQRHETVQICVGQPRRIYRFVGPRQVELNQAFLGPESSHPAAEALLRAKPLSADEIAWNARPYLYMRDSFAMARVLALVQSAGGSWRLRPDNEATFNELRRNPVVVIGGFNSRWGLRFGDAMRFIFDHKTIDGAAFNCITDKRHPQAADWKIAVLGAGTPARDFAVITRVFDPTTERPVILSAGITDYGTLAAGEFLTDRNYLNQALRSAPSGWARRNVQIVLETRIIEETPGPARVLAVHVW